MGSKCRWSPWVLASALVASGCPSFSTLERNLEALQSYRVVGVTIASTSDDERPHLALLIDAETKKVERLSIVHGSGRHEMHVRPGRYYVAAFEDRNENFAFDKGELARLIETPLVVTDDPAGSVLEVAIDLSPSNPPPTPSALALGREIQRVNAELSYNNVGVIVGLDDPIFDQETAEQGMWEPARFVDRELPGIYMLEPHDPERIPVLFVHGIGGSPRSFEPIVDTLDRSKCEPWVLYYPSAMRLSALGEYMRESLEIMCSRFHVPEVVVIAHSMGGLVSSEALFNDGSEERPYAVRLFVTIASPLGGISSARSGVEWAPTVMPAWYDLVPGSPFLEELYPTDTPGFPYYLFFAFRRTGFLQPSGDGVASLSSQLHPAVQEAADGLIGIDAEHMSILSHDRTLEKLGELIERHVTD